MSQSVERALTILTLCAERPHTLNELAEHLGVHRTTALRLLKPMETRGFACRTSDGLFTVGSAFTRIGEASREALELRTLARPQLERLSSEFGHTVHLSEPRGAEVVYIDKIEGRGAVRMHSKVGAAVVLHTAAVAKAILAFSPAETTQRALDAMTFEPFTDTTITSRDAYLAELAATRQHGWAHDDGEFENYLNCIAVPVFDHTGFARGSLSVTALRALEPLAELEKRVPRLRAAAAEISRSLGYTESDTAHD